jgi:hypothetical protein
MSRVSALMAVLSDDPITTSELYDRVGYPALVRLGLIPYASFRAELTRLEAAGDVAMDTARDGSTTWRRARD